MGRFFFALSVACLAAFGAAAQGPPSNPGIIQLLAGAGITLDPANGFGPFETITSTGSGSGCTITSGVQYQAIIVGAVTTTCVNNAGLFVNGSTITAAPTPSLGALMLNGATDTGADNAGQIIASGGAAIGNDAGGNATFQGNSNGTGSALGAVISAYGGGDDDGSGNAQGGGVLIALGTSGGSGAKPDLSITGLTNMATASYALGLDASDKMTLFTVPSSPSGANPTATITTSIQNGSAATFMRSDAAPAAAVATNAALGYAEAGTGLLVSSGVFTPDFGTATNKVAEGGVITAGGPTGSSTVVPVITYNAAGQLTAVTTATIADTVATGITAAGTNQGTATALTNVQNIIATAASGTGVVMQAGVAGGHEYICNYGANTINIYPASGAQINALGTNAAIGEPTGTCAIFISVTTTQWYSVP